MIHEALTVSPVTAADVQHERVTVRDDESRTVMADADHELPVCWAAWLYSGPGYVALRTNDDGACALHAVFGIPQLAGLTCKLARQAAAETLRNLRPRLHPHEGVPEHVRAVQASLWMELAKPVALKKLRHETGSSPGSVQMGEEVRSEAAAFWRNLSPEHQVFLVNYVREQTAAEEVDRQYLHDLDDLCRAFCQPGHEKVCRRIGVELQHLPEEDLDHQAVALQVAQDQAVANEACQERHTHLLPPAS